MTNGEGLKAWLARKISWLRKKLTPREEALARIADALDIADDDVVGWLITYIKHGGVFMAAWNRDAPVYPTPSSWFAAAVERTKRNKELWRILRLARDVELQTLAVLLVAKLNQSQED